MRESACGSLIHSCTRVPSGDTSTDIHVPSSVVNFTVRVGLSGSSVAPGAARVPLSGRAGVWASAGPAASAARAAPSSR